MADPIDYGCGHDGHDKHMERLILGQQIAGFARAAQAHTDTIGAIKDGKCETVDAIRDYDAGAPCWGNWATEVGLRDIVVGWLAGFCFVACVPGVVPEPDGSGGAPMHSFGGGGHGGLGGYDLGGAGGLGGGDGGRLLEEDAGLDCGLTPAPPLPDCGLP